MTPEMQGLTDLLTAVRDDVVLCQWGHAIIAAQLLILIVVALNYVRKTRRLLTRAEALLTLTEAHGKLSSEQRECTAKALETVRVDLVDAANTAKTAAVNVAAGVASVATAVAAEVARAADENIVRVIEAAKSAGSGSTPPPTSPPWR